MPNIHKYSTHRERAKHTTATHNRHTIDAPTESQRSPSVRPIRARLRDAAAPLALRVRFIDTIHSHCPAPAARLRMRMSSRTRARLSVVLAHVFSPFDFVLALPFHRAHSDAIRSARVTERDPSHSRHHNDPAPPHMDKKLGVRAIME